MMISDLHAYVSCMHATSMGSCAVGTLLVAGLLCSTMLRAYRLSIFSSLVKRFLSNLGCSFQQIIHFLLSKSQQFLIDPIYHMWSISVILYPCILSSPSPPSSLCCTTSSSPF